MNHLRRFIRGMTIEPQNRLLRSVLVACLLLACLSACKSDQEFDRQIRATDTALLNQVATKLHVTRDWAAVRTYIYCTRAAVGTERAVVEARLRQIAEVDVFASEDGRRVRYLFLGIPQNLLEYTLIEYDQQEQVVQVFAVHVLNGETQPPELVSCTTPGTATPTVV